jgi:excisionase family DNA binding protein
MTAQAAGAEAITYLPEGRDLAEVVDFVAALASKAVAAQEPRPTLAAADCRRQELPKPSSESLLQLLPAMAHGQAVTVMPHSTLLTTQEAADLLGISRPTVVRLLEAGELPFEHRGRHRRIMLADLLAYQERMRQRRRESLTHMQQEGQVAGLYEATAGPLPPVR